MAATRSWACDEGGGRKAPQRILIAGQGLAGTALAWQLAQRGAPFLAVDRGDLVTSSKIAAGLVTPITGMRLNLSWRYGTLFPVAVNLYEAVERLTNQKLFHRQRVVRLFRDEAARELWRKRIDDAEVACYVNPQPPCPLVDERFFINPFGGFEQTGAGWLDTAAFLETSRRHFQQSGQWMQGEVLPNDLTVHEDRVIWRGEPFAGAVFCTGWEASRHPWFDWVPFRSARGTVLKLETDLGGERRIINRGCWVLPAAGGVVRAGPTYELDFTDPHTPSAEAVAGLESKLRQLLKAGFSIARAQTAVRPIVKGRRGLIGRHPRWPRIAFFNGLGSKGVLRAPWLAQQLGDHLLDGTPLPAEVDLAQNL